MNDTNIKNIEDLLYRCVLFPEPTTSWQHCLDEGTQHYYYWNTATNEVTWEIPEDYSKYLLLLKEYEERLTKYEVIIKEWEERKNKPKKK